jgi:cell fate (sporulation/competence/biofilm development) regulator YlbF (YheA/YmcA/DUF963 family)
MNVYDAAHMLAKSIKKDEDYKKFSLLNKELMDNDEYKSKMKNFQDKQIILQKQSLTGEEIDNDLLEEMQNLYSKLNEIEVIKQYFSLEMKINQMMSDITKILSEAIDIEY